MAPLVLIATEVVREDGGIEDNKESMPIMMNVAIKRGLKLGMILTFKEPSRLPEGRSIYMGGEEKGGRRDAGAAWGRTTTPRVVKSVDLSSSIPVACSYRKAVTVQRLT